MSMRDGTAETEGGPGFRPTPGLVVGAVLGAALAAFIVQNTREVPVKWLVFEATQPLWAVLLITALVAALIAELVGGIRRRRKH